MAGFPSLGSVHKLRRHLREEGVLEKMTQDDGERGVVGLKMVSLFDMISRENLILKCWFYYKIKSIELLHLTVRCRVDVHVSVLICLYFNGMTDGYENCCT